MFRPRANDVLEVIEDKQNGLFKVYSENDQSIYTMRYADLKHEEQLGAEIEWGECDDPMSYAYDPEEDALIYG